MAAVFATVVVGGCGTLFVSDPASIASSVTEAPTGSGLTWTITPWPLDEAAAWLCVDEPQSFGTDTRSLDPASCAPLDVETRPDGLHVTFDARTAPAAVTARLTTTTPPWFLAVSGRKGLSGFAMTKQVVDSPFPSDPGPS